MHVLLLLVDVILLYLKIVVFLEEVTDSLILLWEGDVKGGEMGVADFELFEMFFDVGGIDELVIVGMFLVGSAYW